VKKTIQPLFILLFSIFFTACSAAGAGGPGPRTWIDAPLEGMVLDLGPVIVISHAASEGGTARAALMVNGEEVRADEASDSAAELVEFDQTWTPETEGEYTLQVISTDHGGNEGRSNLVTVCVGQATANCEIASVPSDTPELLTSETPTLTPTATAAEVNIPTITFDQSANCRLGDSTAYDVVNGFDIGETLIIEGRNAATTWFWVLMPGSNAHCFVAGSTGTLAGPYQTVPVITPLPLPVTDTPESGGEEQPEAGAPATPGNVQAVEVACSAQGYKVKIQWSDVDDEDGYRVYRDGALIATTGANATSYTDTPPNTSAHNYGVEAFNDAGTSGRPVANEDGCLF
jgi:hypothetical protein